MYRFIFGLLLCGIARAATAPLLFEANRGQFAEFGGEARYVAQWQNFRAAFFPGMVEFRGGGNLIRIRLGASGVLTATEPASTSIHCFLGRDPANWRSGIPAYRRLRYRDIYPGTNLIFYQSGKNLEFDFVLAPGADPERIALTIESAATLIDLSGELELGPFRLRAPSIYQTGPDGRTPVAGGFRKTRNTLRFAVGRYDRSRPLIIDPELVYSTLIDTNGQNPSAIVTDNEGFVYVTGGGGDIFVEKISPDGTQVVFLTYIGGSGLDWASGIAIGPDGNVYLSGTTESHDFPVVRATQPVMGTPAPYSNEDAVVVELSADGSQILFSTYLGGRNTDYGNAIAVDSSGVIHVTGITESDDFPATTRLWTSRPGYEYNLYTAAIDPNAPAVLYASILAPADGTAIALDSQANAYIAGQTISADFPLIGFPPQDCSVSPCSRGFILKIDASADQVLYAQRLGFAGTDTVQAIATDARGNTYAAGRTTSATFPTTPGVFQPRPGGGVFFRDGANTWERADSGISSISIQALLALSPQTLLAGTPDGVFRSDDGGDSWNFTGFAQSITALAADPNSASSLYAGTTSAGVFLSTDGGVSWNPSTQGFDRNGNGNFPAVNRLVFVPGVPGLIYAATQLGVARSADGGATWTYLARFAPSPEIFTVLADAADPNTLLAATPTQVFCGIFCAPPLSGVYRTSDGGASWKLVLTEAVYDFARDPVQPQNIYAASNGGVYLSTDGGATWSKAGGDQSPAPAFRVGFDPHDASRLYAAVSSSDPQTRGRVFVSSDGGATWSLLFSQTAASPLNDAIFVASDRTRFYLGGTLLSDCYIVKLAPDGTLLASTYFGGGGADMALALALDASGKVYVSGQTGSLDFPLVNPVQAAYGGDTSDGFVAAFSPDLSQLLFSTYIGGSSFDLARALAFDPTGAVYVAGWSGSIDFPELNPPPLPPYNGGHAFLLKLAPK